jgi:dipeptidyl-peptidase-4
LREDKRAAEYEILPTEIHNVQAADGTVLYARMIKPKGFSPERRYPVIVSVYGGPHAQNVRHVWAGADWDQVLAHRGYVVWQLDNRGTAGRGREFASKVYRDLGAKELEDQLAGVEYLRALGFADTGRLGLHGWSYGGYLTLYALTNAPTVFRAGIAGAPVTDWRNYDTIYTERYMGLPSLNETAYDRSSPLKKAANLTARLLLVHNLQDDNVHFLNTVQMADALQQAGKPFELMVYPQKTHGLTGAVRKHWWEMMTRFFDDALR